MQSDENLRFAIEDARTNQQNLLELIHLNDSKAMTLLSVCAPLGAATASGAGLGLFGGSSVLNDALSWGLVAATLFIFVSCAFCFRAMGFARVWIPGREPKFWIAAINHDSASFKQITLSALKKMEREIEINAQHNAKASLALRRARATIMTMPLALIAVATIASRFGA